MAKSSAQQEATRPDLWREPEALANGSARLCRLAEEPLGCRPSMAMEPAAA